jgi:pteridine reductase
MSESTLKMNTLNESTINDQDHAESPVALITGAAKRIGAAIARRFHAGGYRVIIHYNGSQAEAEVLAAELNAARADSARCVQAALTDKEQVDRLAGEALAIFGRLDLLVNNASSFYPTPLAESSQAQWDDLIDSNLRGHYFLSVALSSALKMRRGNIINIIDAMMEQAIADFPIYSIAKAGLLNMNRVLARELAPKVRVNGVSPGAILWPSHLEDPQDEAAEAARAKALAGIPLGRTGAVEDIANAAYFLVTQATYVTGAEIKVDGGRSLR